MTSDVDAAARMSSHRLVRSLMDRLVAAVLVALLVGPGLAVGGQGSTAKRTTASATQAGMDEPPGPTASAAVSPAAPAPATPLAATAHVVLECSPSAGGRVAERARRAPVALHSAPSILRI
jgi:hypothetical protein